MKISVIIPVYNVERYLKRCIESVINQSLREIEVILINDGSTDTSGNICDEYATKDDRIKVIHKPNTGVSAARNDGIAVATGTYISFVDSDDYIEPDMLSLLLSLCDKTESEIAICDVKKKLDGKVIIESYNLETEVPIYNIVSRQNDFIKICGSSCQCLYSSELIKQKGVFFEEEVPLGEDRLFNMKVISSAKSIVYTKIPLYNYIQYENSAVRTFRVDYFERICKFRTKQLEYMKDLHLDDEMYAQIYHHMFLDFVVNCINNAFLVTKSKKNINEVINEILASELVNNSVNAVNPKELGTIMKTFIFCYNTRSTLIMLTTFKLLNLIYYKKN